MKKCLDKNLGYWTTNPNSFLKFEPDKPNLDTLVRLIGLLDASKVLRQFGNIDFDKCEKMYRPPDLQTYSSGARKQISLND